MRELICNYVQDMHSLYTSTKLKLDEYKLSNTKQYKISTILVKKTISIEDALKEKLVTYEDVKDCPPDFGVDIEEEMEVYTEIMEKRFLERMVNFKNKQRDEYYELAKAAEFPYEYMISLVSSYDGDFYKHLEDKLARGKLYDANGDPSAIVFLKTENKLDSNDDYQISVTDSFFVSKIEGDVYYLLDTKGENVKMIIDNNVLKKGIVRNFILFFPGTVHIYIK